ncbi:chemotaxis protein CheB [Pollutimonas subterranea]|nr:chemotaxis protein CheB [Pollutimonas subterranea]
MTLDARMRNIVVMGASAGGVEALTVLFRHLPPDLPAAILVVLHIPAHTPSQLHRILARLTPMPVVVAEDGQALEAGTIYVASADRHLMLDEYGIRITRGPKECRVRPAIDVLFRSAAIVYGPRVTGARLSGALDDGTAGLWAIKDHGGRALVQEPAQAMYASMPESAIRHVDVDFVGPLETLAQQIAAMVKIPIESPVKVSVEKRHIIENQIATAGNGIRAGVMDLGKVSRYTCPDCHGVLVQIEEGSVIRFRCHTGHAFSLKTLIAEVNAAIDSGLWDTLRALEERMMLLRQMADISEKAGVPQGAERCRRLADDAENRLKPLRELVLDADFFGHDPET